MNPEIEKLIKLSVADGVISEKERAVIMRKAEAFGEDKDEVELMLEGELALKKSEQLLIHQDQPKTKREDEIKKCPSCGALIGALQLKCSDCGYDFNKESDSNKQIRDSIKELQNQLLLETNIKKKAQIINTFTLPQTKEALIQLLFLSFSNYEATQDNAFSGNPIKKSWLGKAIQSYNVLKIRRDEDKDISKIVDQYSFLDNNFDGSDIKLKEKRKQIDETLRSSKGGTTKKTLKYSGIGCGGMIFFVLLIILVDTIRPRRTPNMEFLNRLDSINKVALIPTKQEIIVDSLITIEKFDMAKIEANKLSDLGEKNNALDKIKTREYKMLLEAKDIDNARNKANSMSSDYQRENALDDIAIWEINRLIESGDLHTAKSKASLINSEYQRENIIDKILSIEIDKLIENKDFENASTKAKQINNDYNRKDALRKINDSKN